MTAESVQADLMSLCHTIDKLKDPHIIDVELYQGNPRIHLLCIDAQDFCAVLDHAVGNDLVTVDEDWRETHTRISVMDTNGVEVYMIIEKKAAPDAATSKAEEEEEVFVEYTNTSCTIIGGAGPEVKEDSNETAV